MNLMNQKLFVLVLLSAVLGLAFAQGTLETQAANRVGDMLCPFVNILTGGIGRLIIILLLAVAVIMYFAIDARAAKGLAITVGIGAILLLNFGTIQQIFTGYTLSTQAPAANQPRIQGTTIYCGAR